uniref:Uncharacterized protein n=1 Tax=Rhizophora mucronata TaxID=61149 RepID=A0A2P2K827_RHIMU
MLGLPFCFSFKASFLWLHCLPTRLTERVNQHSIDRTLNYHSFCFILTVSIICIREDYSEMAIKR